MMRDRLVICAGFLLVVLATGPSVALLPMKFTMALCWLGATDELRGRL